ncbi:hypothetical protein QJ48_17045 [Paenibacillus sp. A3]|uniref:hypothetical protein n=1 Tax=Paenibacillus sp. A3 TaxID=1337054 RepID=UPI0006D57BA8|nr:hypothetical protein [Paenibacillus sp. A3]KPV58369.1 hypothetical protein QJ48_17045 [Paenibacillus sp. A3]
MKTNDEKETNRLVTVPVLRKTLAAMIPFYRRIASDPAYAAAWTRGVRRADLDTLLRLLRQVGLSERRYASLSTNGIGYFVDFDAPKPIVLYSNATTVRPGTTQFYFNTKVHRAIAKAILPFYREIVVNRPFACIVVRAIRSGNRALLDRLVRSIVKIPHLRSVSIESSGFRLGFKYAASPFRFDNLTFGGEP